MQFWAPSFVEVNGHRQAYNEVSPPGPKGTILLLTGLASKRYGWYNQLDEFGRTYRTIALDHRDIGDSDEASGPYTIVDLADDAAEALHVLGEERTHVVGISLGGYVSLQLAIRHPELVEKLVLVSTSAGGATHVQPGPEMLATLGGSREHQEAGELARKIYASIIGPGFAESHPEAMENIAQIARYRRVRAPAYFRQLLAAMGHDATAGLARISAPTLVIHGDADPLVLPANGDYLAQHIPGAKQIVYHNVGHVPIIEVPERFNRDVLTFLES